MPLGIIIDAFGASRDTRGEVDEDQQSKCFICGIDSSLFDRHGGFDMHIENEHNMWKYVYFMAYLSQKDPQEYNGE